MITEPVYLVFLYKKCYNLNMPTLELIKPREEAEPPIDEDTLRQQYHSQAFELGVNMLGYMGTPTVRDVPGEKVRRIRSTNIVPLGPGISARVQYVEIGENISDLSTKEFEVLCDKGDGIFTRQATLKNPALPVGATAIAYEEHVLYKNRLSTDIAFLEMLTYMRDELQANNASFR